jgi:exopolyphosphatase/guanosine-5'-triphosphate,3'-diphosphate pyrophosphatase
MRRLASIDIGSQTIRLLVADVSPDGKLLPVLKNSAIIRLGESMNDDSCLTTESIERAASSIADFIDQAQELHPISIYAVATACVRAAKNKTDFLRTIFNKTGIMPTILTGQEEALTALEGVKSVLNKMHAPMIVLDIGGGSTELVYIDDHKIIKTKSIPMGVIGCTERYLMHDPPSVSDISTIRRAIANIISKNRLFEDNGEKYKILVGTAGTITTLAAMDLCMIEYDPLLINGHILTVKRMKKLFDVLLSKNIDERGRMLGLEPGRAAVIIAGTAIVLEIMRALKIKTLQVSDAGLLEGVLLQKINSFSFRIN